MSKVDDLVAEATQVAHEQMLIFMASENREPTAIESTLFLLQAQLAVLSSAMFDDSEIVQFWQNVIVVMQGSKPLPDGVS